jgi:hypothetical protein
MTDDLDPELSAIGAARRDIDALVDGEPIDKDALRQALGDEDARDYLIDALILRQLARDLGPSHFVAPARPLGKPARFVRGLAAMLVLTLGVAGGYFYGQRSEAGRASEPGQAAIEAEAALPAPEPTRVIRFEPGVNWTKSNGSH